MQLVEGAEAIAGDLPEAALTRIQVPLEAGDAEDSGIHRLSSLRAVRERLAVALEQVPAARVPLTIGGDCGVAYQAAAAAAAGRRLAVLWFDAHADANSPESSPSHAFAGMVARSLVDDGVVDAARLVLAGTRAWDDAEAEWVAEAGVTHRSPDELGAGGDLAEVFGGLGADGLYVHVDLDALDPLEFDAVSFPQPFGLSLDDLLAAIGAARSVLPLLGASIAGFSPADDTVVADAMPTILRIIGALSKD